MTGAEIKVWNYKGESPPCPKCLVQATCYKSSTRKYKKTGNEIMTIKIGAICDEFNKWMFNFMKKRYKSKAKFFES
jgi:hypothetical protein